MVRNTQGVSMNNFEHIQKIMELLNNSEDELKVLRDYVDMEEKNVINETLRMYIPIRDNLWKLDKILENKKK